MKIIASSTGQDLDAALDPRFGRCAYFAVIDTDSGSFEAIPNPFLDAAGGAGTQAAQWVLNQGAEILLTGKCGPKASAVFADSGIRIVEGASGSLREASASLTISGTATALVMSGQSRSITMAAQGTEPGRGAGQCRRAGGRQGCGRGRGAGRGRGRGPGRQGQG